MLLQFLFNCSYWLFVQGRLKALYALVSETLRHGSELDAILRGSQLLIKEPRLDAWLARVLITQLLWREQPLSSPALPFKIILSYESELRALQEKLSSTVSESGLFSKVLFLFHNRVSFMDIGFSTQTVL